MPVFNEGFGSTVVNLILTAKPLSTKAMSLAPRAFKSGMARPEAAATSPRAGFGEQPGDNPQAANYADGGPITQKWIGVDPNSFESGKGIYIFNSLQQLTASTSGTQDLYGANIQTGLPICPRRRRATSSRSSAAPTLPITMRREA